MRFFLTTLITFCFNILSFGAITKLEYENINGQLNIKVFLNQNGNFKLNYYNKKSHFFEQFECTSIDQCSCNTNLFTNFSCEEQDYEQLLFSFYKFPYSDGDMIYESDNLQNKNSTIANHKLQLRNLDSFVQASQASSLVTYSSTDLSSSLQMGSFPLFMKWQIYDNGTFDMVFEYNQLNWLGIGFCPTMDNCDMLLLYQYNNIVLVIDTYSRGHDTPPADSSQDVFITSQMINSTGYSVRFNRKLDTGDTLDQVLEKGGVYTFCIAWSGSTSVEEHSVWYNFDITFDNNIVGVANLVTNPDPLYFVHAIVLFIAWGIVADFGIIIGRFFKTINSYLWIHAISFLFVDLSTVVLVIILLCVDMQGGQIEDGTALDIHSVLAIIILVLIFIQHIGGVVIKHFLESNAKDNRQVAFKIRIFHQILGTILFIGAKIMLITGFIANDYPILLILCIIWIALLIVVRIALEYYYSSNSRIKTKIVPQIQGQLNETQDKLLKLLSSNISTEEISLQLPNIKWVLFNNDVYDITNYQHPGGNFIMSNLLGKEISRYFYGAFQLESTTMSPHVHSQLAYKALQKRYLGNINTDNQNISEDSQYPWKLIEKTQISKNISIFYLTQQQLSIRMMQNLSDFGKHFSFSLEQIGGKTRLYTKILCMSKIYQDFRDKVIKYHENQINEIPKLVDEKTNQIPFIIKRYNFPNALSEQIFNHQGQFWIEGPFGRGLELQANSKSVAFVGGTGLLPFLDLLDFLLMKSIHLVNKSKQEQISQFFPKCDQVGEEFQFTLLASFQNEDEFVGKEWIRKLYEINIKNNLKLFDMKVRYSDSKLDQVIPAIHGRFNDSFIRSSLGDFTKQVYVCGPPNMMYSITQIIKHTPQNQEKVMIV